MQSRVCSRCFWVWKWWINTEHTLDFVLAVQGGRRAGKRSKDRKVI